ncbi:alpha-L-fucosidase [bacterium]|nr:MAG: alpha-L-fucosidase [bacterium]
MLTLISALALAPALLPPVSAPQAESKRDHDRRMSWFREARFGMFIHWGLYAIPAGEWPGKPGGAEWIMTTSQIPVKEYEPLAKRWNPTQFNAREWVRMAKEAGMKYIVITSKHHDGFGIWPSKAGDWNSGRTAFRRDALKEMAAACKDAGIRLCFYHSIMDWHHPDYLPKRPWDKEGEATADFDRYVRYMKAQLKELLTEYGDIGILWFDGEWEGTWTHERGKDLYSFVRALQPNIIVNNRVDKGRAGMAGMTEGDHAGDYGTPEQEIPSNGFPGVDWESCMTMNNNWGYVKGDQNWKSASTLIQNLIDCASKGGNYLLNVGPTAEGLFPGPSVERLAEIGKWTKANGTAIYGTSAGPFPKPLPWGRVTRKGNRLFLHVFTSDTKITLPGFRTNVTGASGWVGGQKVAYRRTEGGYELDLKGLPRDPHATVIALDIRGAIQVDEILPVQAADGSLELPAADATVKGGTARYESDKKAIGYWTNVKDAVAWTFQAQPGDVEIELEYACADDSAGAEYEVEIAGQKLKGKVEATGDWSDFKRVKLGRATLKGEKTTLVVRPLSKPGLGVMNLRAVRLRR